MEIKRLKAVPFGTASISKIVTGWALYEPGKGYYAFSSFRDQFGILTPYIPQGGTKALQSIVNSGGFASMDGMEFVNPVERPANESQVGISRFQVRKKATRNQTAERSKIETAVGQRGVQYEIRSAPVCLDNVC